MWGFGGTLIRIWSRHDAMFGISRNGATTQRMGFTQRRYDATFGILRNVATVQRIDNHCIDADFLR
jgi:hypothetical protein